MGEQGKMRVGDRREREVGWWGGEGGKKQQGEGRRKAVE